MNSPTGSRPSTPWMIRTGWVLTVLTEFNMIFDSVGKLMPLSGFLLEEFHRLGESEDKALYYGLLQFSCGLLYVIPGPRSLARSWSPVSSAVLKRSRHA